ncbi:hypothetical protein [Ruminococcus albus]|uniref:Lipocalin-like domain-containing protein n=1 Tax=Ruminococcus albus TaxID=1264 RepID=A0A1H7ISD9_RUMAL|nr:hypothetical protein [Ruminococcus albus]SEK65403.1 hypothetical protein SAMN05216469_10479 [Ruminococcus albus]
MKKFVAMIMVAVMCCFMLTSCGDSKYVGTWKSESEEVGMTITLEKDHTAKMAFGGIESGEEDKIEWEVKDKKIILKDGTGKDDSTMEFDIVDSKTIAMTESGLTVNFKKQ